MLGGEVKGVNIIALNLVFRKFDNVPEIFLNHLLTFRYQLLFYLCLYTICLKLAAFYLIRRACFRFQFEYFLVWPVIDIFPLEIFQPSRCKIIATIKIGC